jgi:hypothetical protein
MRRRDGLGLLCMTALAALAPSAGAQSTPPPAKRKPDLGDVAESRYRGDVISGARRPERLDQRKLIASAS